MNIDEFMAEHGLPECRRAFVAAWMKNGGTVPPRLILKLKKEEVMANKVGRPVGSKDETNRRRVVLMKVIENPDTSTAEMLETQRVLIALDEKANEGLRLKSLAKENERLTKEVAAKDEEITKLKADNDDLTARLKESLQEQLAQAKGVAR